MIVLLLLSVTFYRCWDAAQCLNIVEKRQKLSVVPTSAWPTATLGRKPKLRDFRLIRGCCTLMLESIGSPLIGASASTSAGPTLSLWIIFPVFPWSWGTVRCEFVASLPSLNVRMINVGILDKNWYNSITLIHLIAWLSPSLQKLLRAVCCTDNYTLQLFHSSIIVELLRKTGNLSASNCMVKPISAQLTSSSLLYGQLHSAIVSFFNNSWTFT